jgi:hypothetical protein
MKATLEKLLSFRSDYETTINSVAQTGRLKLDYTLNPTIILYSFSLENIYDQQLNSNRVIVWALSFALQNFCTK